MKELFHALLQAADRSEDTVLVSITERAGSTPRGLGAHMLVGQKGRLCGTIGGGIVEAEALRASSSVLKERRSRSASFVLREESGIGSVCGGEVTVHYQYLSGSNERIRAAAARAAACLEKRVPGCLFLGPLDSDACALSVRSGEGTEGAALPDDVPQTSSPQPCRVATKAGIYLMQPLVPSGRVYIFGGGHVAQALVPLLVTVDFRCVIVEDRLEFCRPELFPGVEETLLIEPENWERELSITSEDYICVMTRGHRGDTDSQAFALRTKAQYIGVIGSRQKIAYVNAELMRRGFTEKDLSRVVTPIGLPILAETPAEIAVSIAAQLIQVRAEGRQKRGKE